MVIPKPRTIEEQKQRKKEETAQFPRERKRRVMNILLGSLHSVWKMVGNV